MDITIHPGKLSGQITVVPSKSQAHRLLICAAFSDGPTVLLCPDTNRDIESTVSCLNALGAEIKRTDSAYHVTPIRHIPQKARLFCGESGSTLRFLLPIAGALGVDATFLTEGRLSQRPLSPLWEEMERMGCILTRPNTNTVRCQGKLRAGQYIIDGGISSQFVSGLLFAVSLIKGESDLKITGNVESRPYIDMTKQAMSLFDAPHYHSPGTVSVEGDWSSAAFFLAANTLGCNIGIPNLNYKSIQGDRAIVGILPRLRKFTAVNTADIPDLTPILSVVASANLGAKFQNIGRLRLKESDRVASIIAMLESLGGKAEASDDVLTVFPAKFKGGTVDSKNDHRIAMSAAVAAVVSTGAVTISGAECVNKSYPHFWDDYRRLGGRI